MKTLTSKEIFVTLRTLAGMAVVALATTLPFSSMGAEGGSIKSKKAGVNKVFTFEKSKNGRYTGTYTYSGSQAPFSMECYQENGKAVLKGSVEFQEIGPENFTISWVDKRGWLLKIFESEYEMEMNLPLEGGIYNVQLQMPEGATPMTMVWIDKEFWIGQYEVTQAHYEAVMKTNPSKWKGPNLPVSAVTWNDAMEYCKRLTDRERAAGRLPAGYHYTLPTEGQWEYSCRAGTMYDYNVDGVDLGELAWYKANSGGRTHPVGEKLPNAFGLYDMHGNVFEMCLDKYIPIYPNTPSNRRVIRGGGFHVPAEGQTSGYREDDYPDGDTSHGFRVVLAPVR